MTALRRAVVYEAQTRGHHLGWARRVAGALVRPGWEVLLVVPRSAFDTAEGRVKLGEDPGVRIVTTAPDVPEYGWRAAASREFDGLVETIDSLRPDHLVVASADHVLMAPVRRRFVRTLARDCPVDLIVHLVRPAYPLPLWRRAPLRVPYELSRPARLLTPDPFAADHAGGRVGVTRRVDFLGHPVDPPTDVATAQARVRLGLDPEVRAVVLVGDLRSFGRKAEPTLLAAAGRFARNTGQDVVVVIEGLHDVDGAELAAAAAPAQVRARNEFVSDERYGLLLRAADAAWGCLPGHAGVSSTVLNAAAAGTPVITLDWGSQGWLGRRLSNCVITTLDVDDAADALGRAFRTEPVAEDPWFHHVTDPARFAAVLRAPFEGGR